VLVDDVIAALRRFGPVEVSALSGKQERIQFRLPDELAETEFHAESSHQRLA
jgi:4-hydroxy-3-methylbut-2-enyl diphosphate reductase